MTGTFVDTNVVVYLYDEAEPTKQARARELFDSDESHAFVVSTQVLGEFYVTARHKLRFTAEYAQRALRLLLAYPVQAVDAAIVMRALETLQRRDISYWDALIVEAAVAAGCERILTEDLTDGQTIRGVEIVNPFATESTA